MAVIGVDQVGDLADAMIARCAAAGVSPERLWILDAADPRWALPWNPFLTPGDPFQVSTSFVDIVARHAGGLGVETDYVLRNICHALVVAKKSPLEIELLLTNERFRRTIVENLRDGQLLTFFAQYDELSDGEKRKRHAWIANKLHRFLGSPQLRRILCANSGLPLSAINDNPRAILIVALRRDQLHSGADLLCDLVVQGLWNATLTRSRLPENERPPTTLFLDEVQGFANDALFEQVITQSRRYNLRLVLAHQNCSQLDSKVGEAIRTNNGVLVMFRLGTEDARAMSSELLPMGRSDSLHSLRTLGIGEAFARVGGADAVRVQTPNCRAVDHRQVPNLREASMRCHATPCKVLDEEIEDRYRADAGLNCQEVPKEVRHVRLPRNA